MTIDSVKQQLRNEGVEDIYELVSELHGLGKGKKLTIRVFYQGPANPVDPYHVEVRDQDGRYARSDHDGSPEDALRHIHWDDLVRE